MARSSKARKNIYFRQNPKEFRSLSQTKVYSHINRNLPYRIVQYSKKRFVEHKGKIINFFSEKWKSKFKV